MMRRLGIWCMVGVALFGGVVSAAENLRIVPLVSDGEVLVSFELADTPTNTSPSAVTVTVGGQSVPFDPSQQNGWTYDADTNAIVFWGDAIPDPGEAIVIRYPYDAGC